MRVNRRKLLSLLGASPALLAASQARAEGTKTTDVHVPAGEAMLSALTPKGIPPAVPRYSMAPRLDTIDGKTIFLVDTGFLGGDLLLQQMQLWFQQNKPTVKIELRKKAGTYPTDDPKLWAEIKANGNAVIMAIGHCGGCTPATVTHCITMEKMGVPAVPVITRAYHDLALSTAAEKGMPLERITFTPHPVWGKTPDELAAYLKGADPVSGKPMMKEIQDALTTPLTADEQKTGMIQPVLGPATFGPDSADNLQQHYLDNGMTDYLPIIVPTEEKVAAMLKGTSHSPDEVIGHAGSGEGGGAAWKFTVRQVAVNAVMAGCLPEYLPVLLAVASVGALALGTSTTSFGYSMVVNGPIRDKLQMNYGIGALSPFAQSNAALGRAWNLMGKNLAQGSVPGITYWGGQGNNLNYGNAVIAEDEKNSPWTPFHVQKGFKPDENVVSVFSGWDIRMGHGAKGAGIEVNPKFDEQIASMLPTLTRMFNCMLIIDPLTAQALVKQGYDTKEKLTDWLWKNTPITAKEYRESFLAHVWLYPRALSGEEPYATWWKLPDDAVIPPWPKADNISVVVVGGQTNTFFQVGNMNYGRSVSIDKWM